MKLLYTLLFTIFACVLTLNTHAQARVDTQVDVVKIDSLADLSNVKGWYHDSKTGKWVDSLEKPRFWRWAALQYKGNKYYAFIYDVKTWKWEYPAIRKNWVYQNDTYYIIFDPKQYAELINQLKQKSGKQFSVKGKWQDSNSGSDLNSIDQSLGAELVNGLESVLKYDIHILDKRLFPFNSQSLDGKDIVRFAIPVKAEDYSSKYLDNSYYELPLKDMLTAMMFQ